MLKDRLVGLFDNIVAWGAIAVLAATGLAVWAAIKHYSAFEVALVFIGVLAASAYVLNTVRGFWPKGKRWKDDEVLGDQLNSWLRKASYKLKDIPEEDMVDPPLVSFAFLATDEFERGTIVMKATKETFVGLLCIIQPSPEHAPIIDGMASEVSAAMHGEVALELARSGMGFDARNLKAGVRITFQFTPSDRLTSETFLEIMGVMHRGTMVVQVIVNKYIRQAQIAAGETPKDDAITMQPSPLKSVADTASTPSTPTS